MAASFTYTKVCMLATQRVAGAHNIMTALTKFGWDYEVLGMNKEFKGWVMRMQVYHDFAARQDPNALIVFIDSYDALPLRSPIGFVEAFESFGSDIVVGTERHCGSNCVQVKDYWSSPQNRFVGKNITGHKFANAGCVIGRASALVQMLKWSLDNKLEDDQIAVGRYINEAMNVAGNPKVELDAQSLLVFNDLTDWDLCKTTYAHDEKSHIVVRHKGRGTTPFFVHFPGFLLKRTFFNFVGTKQFPLKNYDAVGKLVLGTEFVEVSQINNKSHRARNIALAVVFWLLVLALFLLIFFLAITHKKLRFYRRAYVQPVATLDTIVIKS